MSDNTPPPRYERKHINTLGNGLKIYEVSLVGGPANGLASVCSHDTVIWNDDQGSHRYQRGPDDGYHYQSPAHEAPLFVRCLKPHSKPCLSLPEVMEGHKEPCAICAPDKEKVRKLHDMIQVMQAGHGGILKGGRIVDRREHPEASTLPANRILGIPKPAHTPSQS